MTRDDPLLKQADTLVAAANANAIAMFIPLLDQFSLLRHVDPQHWDFILTVAGVFVAVTRLGNLHLDHDREQKLLEKVQDGLTRWDAKNGVPAFEDCKAFFERNSDAPIVGDPRFVTSDPIGLWIVWNILKRGPQTDEEWKLVRVVGAMITHAFFNWWDDQT